MENQSKNISSFKDTKQRYKFLYEKSTEEEKKILKDMEYKIQETEKLNKLMVGRELKMIELKKEITRLKQAKD